MELLRKLGQMRRFQAVSASKIQDMINHEAAVEFIRENVQLEHQQEIIQILQAAQADTDREWLTAFNAWLNLKRSGEIGLVSGTKERFFRLTVKDSGIDIPRAEGSQPKITVIMTAYNAAETLSLAAQSILQQTWNNLELVIVSDASTDTTDQLIAELCRKDSRVIGLRNAVNIGTFASKNRGLQAATGDYITAHDSDDWALPQRLERQMTHMIGSTVGTLGEYIRLRTDGKPSRVQPLSKITADGFCQFANVSLVLKRSVALERAGFWDCLRFAADREYVDRCKILFGSDLKITRDLTMLCLVHDKNLSVSVSKSGIWARKNLLARHSYRKSFRRWHAANKVLERQHNLCLPFPLLDRPFSVPAKMQVGLAAQKYLESLAKTDL